MRPLRDDPEVNEVIGREHRGRHGGDDPCREVSRRGQRAQGAGGQGADSRQDDQELRRPQGPRGRGRIVGVEQIVQEGFQQATLEVSA